jgi:hypothetical protein
MSAFETAVSDSKKLTSKPSNDELLELYGSFISITTLYPWLRNILLSIYIVSCRAERFETTLHDMGSG